MTDEQLDMIKRLQPFFNEKMGRWQEIDEGYCVEHKQIYYYAVWPDDGPCCDREGVRIPKPIDWQNPERGLWGMIDSEWRQLISRPTNATDSRCRYSDNAREIFADDPFTALLKTLCHQEKV
jgi:hypothetical protein